MIHDLTNYVPEEILSLPALSEKDEQDVQDFLLEAKKINDDVGIDIVSRLMSAITRLEAGSRNMARILAVYRRQIPRLVRACNHKLKEEENK